MSRDYEEHLNEQLQDPRQAIAYLQETAKEPTEVFMLALWDVLKAQKTKLGAPSAEESCVECAQLERELEQCVQDNHQLERDKDQLLLQNKKICNDNADIHKELGKLRDNKLHADAIILALQQRIALVSEHTASLNRIVVDMDEYTAAWTRLRLGLSDER